MRTFTDDTGREWEAWQCVPEPSTERRHGERRVAQLAYAAPERRILPDRRSEEDRRVNASPDGTRPWVCFKSAGEMRRCDFVPENWEQLSERELRILLRLAKPGLRRNSGSSSAAEGDGDASESTGTRTF